MRCNQTDVLWIDNQVSSTIFQLHNKFYQKIVLWILKQCRRRPNSNLFATLFKVILFFMSGQNLFGSHDGKVRRILISKTRKWEKCKRSFSNKCAPSRFLFTPYVISSYCYNEVEERFQTDWQKSGMMENRQQCRKWITRHVENEVPYTMVLQYRLDLMQ